MSVGFLSGSAGEESPFGAGDMGDTRSILGLRRSPGEGNGNPLSILAWEIPGTEEFGWLSPWGCKKVRQDLATENNEQLLKYCRTQ